MIMYIYIFLLAAIGGATAEIPQVSCNPHESTFEDCLGTSFEPLFPTLTLEGIPELNILPLDPLDIPSMPINMKTKLYRGHIDVTNTVLKGLSKLKFKKFKTEKKSATHYQTDVKVYIPQLLVAGDFSANMNVTKLNIVGDGSYFLRLKKLDVAVKVHEELVNRGSDSQEAYYLKMYKVTVNPVIGGFKLNATLTKNPKLAQLGVNFVNTFWPVTFKQVYPYFAPHIQTIVLDHLREYFDKVPIYSHVNNKSSTSTITRHIYKVVDA